MKYLKMIGLAAVAATAIMAFLGAGTASASGMLCTEDVAEACPSANMLKHAIVEGVATDPFLEVNAKEHILCEKSVLSALVNENGTGSEGKITWSGCSNNVSGCAGSTTTVTTLEKRTGLVEWTGAHKFSVVTNEPTTTVVMASCFGIKTTCTYKPATIKANGTNGNPAAAVVNESIASPGFPCPSGIEKATYNVHVVSGETLAGVKVSNIGFNVAKITS